MYLREYSLQLSVLLRAALQLVIYITYIKNWVNNNENCNTFAHIVVDGMVIYFQKFNYNPPKKIYGKKESFVEVFVRSIPRKLPKIAVSHIHGQST